MWRQFLLKIASKQNTRWAYSLLLVLVLFVVSVPHSSADILLHNKNALLSSSEIGETSQYIISFSFPAASTYGSLKIEVCANDPIPSTSCVAPAGFDLSSAVLSSQTGPAGFLIVPGSTANKMILGRLPGPAVVEPASYTLDNIMNPSSPGAYFIRMQTYASPDATGPEVFQGGIAFLMANHVQISATVPPYITFCTGLTITGLNCANAQGDYIDFGELSSKQTSSGTSQMLAATNAQSGYNLTVQGTTMTSGNNEIKALASNDVSRPGTAQFGLNLTVNSTPSGGAVPVGPGVTVPVAQYSTPDSYRFVNGETLATNTVPDDVRVFTTSYIVNVPKAQDPGIYVTTITYICLASF